MAKMTMHQELDLLRKEVIELKKQKVEAQKTEMIEIEEEKAEIVALEEEEEHLEGEFKSQINEFVEKIKIDYDNLSPVAAVLIFALGAMFGSSFSSNHKE